MTFPHVNLHIQYTQHVYPTNPDLSYAMQTNVYKVLSLVYFFPEIGHFNKYGMGETNSKAIY